MTTMSTVRTALGRAGIALFGVSALVACGSREAGAQAQLAAQAEHGEPSKTPLMGPELVEPEILRSHDGLLDITLTATPQTVQAGGQTFRANVYNGRYLAPTLFIRRDDQVRLRLENRIGPADIEVTEPQPTNLHFHGMAIPPVKPADYVYLTVTPWGLPANEVKDHAGHAMPASPDIYSGSFEYEWRVPSNHPVGDFWYHPHAHGFTEGQVLGGMSGFMLIDGLVSNHYPELGRLRERVLVLKEIDLPGAANDAPPTKLVNGQLNPTVPMKPGEWQVWHLGNLGANAFWDLGLEGRPIWVLARDGNLLAQPELVQSVFIPPSGRATVVVGGFDAGRQTLHSQFVDTGPAGDPNPDVVVATLDVRGDPVDGAAIAARLRQPALDLAGGGPTEQQLRALPITRQRVIEYSETADGDTFFINGQEFDQNRNDVTVQLGDVEEWTIRNVTGELHTFHIHQGDFLVTRYQGEVYDQEGLRDVVDVPYQRNGTPGEVTVIIPFTNPTTVGRYPFHCHLLEHEDNGMMANLLIQPAATTPQAK